MQLKYDQITKIYCEETSQADSPLKNQDFAFLPPLEQEDSKNLNVKGNDVFHKVYFRFVPYLIPVIPIVLVEGKFSFQTQSIDTCYLKTHSYFYICQPCNHLISICKNLNWPKLVLSTIQETTSTFHYSNFFSNKEITYLCPLKTLICV